jgi:threonine dehydratase
MRRLGAEVVLQGQDFDAAKAFAKDYAASGDLPFVEDGASAAIAEGAGTIAAELTDACADIDAVFVPLGTARSLLVSAAGSERYRLRPE